MTQIALAAAVGASRRSVITWEKPGTRVPTRRVPALEKLMGLTEAELRGDAQTGPHDEMAALVQEHGLVPCLAALAKAARSV